MNKQIAFVKVPKTAASSILYKKTAIWHPGFRSLNYNGECYIKHKLPFHIGKKNYCHWNNFDQHICSSAYKNLGKEEYYYYTQIRDPYDMACSLYFFLKREKNSSIIGTNVDADYHNHKLILSKASINDFLENMSHNQTYTHYYDDLDISDFDCVGWSSNMKETEELILKIFNIKINVVTLNINPEKKMEDVYNFQFTRNDFKKLNEKEYEIYNHGIEKFQNLCYKYL
jgi:hypothetical protein